MPTASRPTAPPSSPVFHFFAGPNGAGKTTLYRALAAGGLINPELEFVNADLHERAFLQHIADPIERSQAARQWADTRRSELLVAGQSFASETVFSHESKLELLAEAQRCGFVVALYVVALDNPAQLVQRVATRIGEGGHPVPPERILARYQRSLALLQAAVSHADVAFLYDAVDIEHGGHQLAAIVTAGQPQPLVDPLPRWVRSMLIGRPGTPLLAPGTKKNQPGGVQRPDF
ncbi:MAG: AAA family ATPase [Burkholderiaceae bacterium]